MDFRNKYDDLETSFARMSDQLKQNLQLETTDLT